MKNIINKQSVKYCFCFFAAFAILTSCSKNNVAPTPQAQALSPDSAAGGDVISLQGTGLSDMRSIIFEKDSVPVAFNPVFNTNSAIIFRVPDTAYGGAQNVIFTNKDGKKLSLPFNVIALATVSSASLQEFTTGTEITLTGNNLDNVTEVSLHGTSDKAEIVSASRKELVIKMPSTSVNRAKLDITNASGLTTTSQEFVSVDNAKQIFTDDFGAGISNWSWATTSVSSDYALIGSNSIKATYGKGGWAAISLHCDPTLDASQYTYLTFWIKGGTSDTQMDVQSENGGTTNAITIPAKVWSYYKFPVAGFIIGFPLERLDFKMHGPDDADQTVYVDDILLVK